MQQPALSSVFQCLFRIVYGITDYMLCMFHVIMFLLFFDPSMIEIYKSIAFSFLILSLFIIAKTPLFFSKNKQKTEWRESITNFKSLILFIVIQ